MSKVVIIGSGLGGLTCGFILQKNGYDVTILEQGVLVNSFKELVPRMNDIFIKLVTEER